MRGTYQLEIYLQSIAQPLTKLRGKNVFVRLATLPILLDGRPIEKGGLVQMHS